MNNAIRVEVSKSPITLDKVSKTAFQKAGTKTAQIRQEIKTQSFYPSKKVTSDLQSGLFATEEFGFTEQMFPSDEVRVAFILVPENATEAQVVALLAKANEAGACIYRHLSSAPILDENQKSAIVRGMLDSDGSPITIDQFANSQVVRYPDNAKTQEDGTAGQIIKNDAGYPMYRRTFYWNVAKEDIDVRDDSKSYVSPEIALELVGAMALQNQEIK